jgi:5-methylcytosine-specific restriction endonuclease McrA
VSARTKQYDESNPDKLAVRLQKRKLSTVGDRSDIKQHYFTLLQTQNGLCRYCKEKLDSNYEIDHITPVSKNGDNKLSNLALSCRQCNREKHNKTLFEYIEWRLERNMFVAEDDFDNYKKNKPKSWVELLTPYLTSKNL